MNKYLISFEGFKDLPCPHRRFFPKEWCSYDDRMTKDMIPCAEKDCPVLKGFGKVAVT